MFVDYGVRVADLVTLSNAVRLSVAVRQRGLTGPSLQKFIDEAPLDMRDASTKKAFRYDPDQRKLLVDLRTKSTVLGDKSYALPL